MYNTPPCGIQGQLVFADQKLKDPVRVSRLRHGIVQELNFWFKQKK